MIIRNGNYTLYKKYDFALFEARQEAPIPFTHFIVKWYLDDVCPFEEFKLNEHGSIIKIFDKNDIKNAYFVKTMCKYQGDEFWLWSYNESRNAIGLITYDSELAERYNFLKLSDRYIKEVNPKELNIIWEERRESDFGLPIPEGLELKKHITLIL